MMLTTLPAPFYFWLTLMTARAYCRYARIHALIYCTFIISPTAKDDFRMMASLFSGYALCSKQAPLVTPPPRRHARTAAFTAQNTLLFFIMLFDHEESGLMGLIIEMISFRQREAAARYYYTRLPPGFIRAIGLTFGEKYSQPYAAII